MAAAPVLAAVSIGTTIAGGMVSAAGASAQAKAQQQQYAYMQQVAKINAQIERQNADYQRVVGDVQAQSFGVKARQRMGQITAMQGASGIKVGSGSPADIRDSQAMLDQHDQATIRSNAARRAYAHETKAWELENQATMHGAASSNAKTAGAYAVASSILGTASSVSSKWLQAKQSGMFAGDSSNNSLLIYGPGY